MAGRQFKAEVDVKQPMEPVIFPLAASPDHDTLRELAEFLAVNRGSAVRIDGAAADRIGAQAAQILVVAGRSWAADGVAFGLDDPTGAVAASFARLGLADMLPDANGTEGAAA